MQENEFWNKLKKWKIIITIEPTLDSIDRPISKTDIFSQSKADNLQIYDSVLEVGVLEPDVDNDTNFHLVVPFTLFICDQIKKIAYKDCSI